MTKNRLIQILKMLKFDQYDGGLCEAADRLKLARKISQEESTIIKNYIYKNTTTRFGNSSYAWMPGLIAERHEWINQRVEMLSNQVSV